MLVTRWVATALFVIALPLLLLLTNVRIAASEERVYGYSYSQYDAPARTGIERAELDSATTQIVAYFNSPSGDDLLALRVLKDGREEALFTQREVLHMRDVRNLFQLTYRIHEIAFVYVVGYIAAVFLWSRERPLRRLAQQATIAGGLTAGLLAIAAGGVLVGFDQLFTEFHLLSFSNDFWRLDPATHHLVQMFPEKFWFDVSLAVGVVTLLEGALVASAGLAYLVWLDRSSPASPPGELTPVP